MNRRTFLKSLAVASCATLLKTRPSFGALPKAKIIKVTAYAPPNLNPLFNQSNIVVTVETDAGLTGIGEGGARDTLEQCAGRLIGRNPFDIERCWQDMYRAFFYPPGREKLHALGALDLALWDIKGKALNVPVYDLLGGMNRNHCECYWTGAPVGQGLRDRAQAVIAAGYRAFRMDAASARGTNVYNTHERIHKLYEDCKIVREAIGKDADWLIDFHQRFDYSDALRGCKLLEDLEPYFIEDAVKTDAFNEDIPKLRKITSVPLAAGEEWGARWDFNKLVENHDLDYVRATLPNVGGITEMTRVMALCETHNVGIVPHFTGPISTAALVHTLGTFPGPVLMENTFNGREFPYLPECITFKNGKLWPNDRIGLGVTVDFTKLTKITEITQPITDRATYVRPDGSQTNW